MNFGTSKPLFGGGRVWIIGLALAVFFATLYLAPFSYAQKIVNPIEAESFEELITAVADAVTEIAFLLAGVAIIFAGFKFLVAGAAGDEKGITSAKKMFFWVLIGTAIAVGASQLAKVVVDTVQQLGS